jgi:hypothetical protein
MKKRMTSNMQKAYDLVAANDGQLVMKDVAYHLNVPDPLYGLQREASRVIAALRKLGKFRDVEKRSADGLALTRGNRNVKLWIAR